MPEALLVAAVSGNVLVLGVFKYVYPGLLLAPDGVSAPFAVPQLLAPIGLVVVVCHAVSYVVDVYRGEVDTYRSPMETTVYLLFFPVLLAGPILRHRDVRGQFVNRKVGMAAFSYGVRRFVVGLGKTLLIAQTLAEPADLVFAMPADQLGLAHAWLGITCFSLQIYFDFSGYADMAIGLGRMLGFRLPENFKWPYAADSVHDFWRRWNISLIGWIGTYPGLRLDGERQAGRLRTFGRIVTLFLLVGAWHGPGWNVIRWGLFQGAIVALERAGFATHVNRLPGWLRHAYLLLMVVAGWVLFRTDTASSAAQFGRALVGLGPDPGSMSPVPLTPTVSVALVVGAVGAAPLMSWLSRWVVTVDAMATSILMLVGTAALFTWRSGVRAIAAVARLFRQ